MILCTWNSIKVKCIETGVIYRSISECSRELSIPPSSISEVCNGILTQTHGFHFEKIIDTETTEKE